LRIVVIGSVAAGTSAAAKARRNDESAEIVIYEKDRDISYSGCGLPYYIGGVVKERAKLTPRDEEFFKQRYNIDVFTGHSVTDIDTVSKRLSVANMATGERFEDRYDKLLIATGAHPIMPPIPGIDKPNVFPLRNVAHADAISEFIQEKQPRRAVIIGGGFIGLEMAENLVHRGIAVDLADMAPQVMTPLDPDMAIYVQQYLERNGVKLYLGHAVEELLGKDEVDTVRLAGGIEIETDMVIMAIGIKPEVELAKRAGVALGPTGAIAVDTRMRTNVPDIYAAGDCAEAFSVINGKPLYRPLGSTANKMGRIAGDQMTGGDLEFRGILGTGIFKTFDMAVAQTGLSEKEAKDQGYDVVVCHNIKYDHADYYPDSAEMVIKAVADKATHKILGAQIVGPRGVDKRIDVFVTAITFGAKAEDLFHLDLAYAPPFSTAKDPVMYTGMILEGILKRQRPLMTPDQLIQRQMAGEPVTVIDTREPEVYEKGHIEGAVNIPLEDLRCEAGKLDKNMPVVTYCNRGVTGNAAQNLLLQMGFKEVYNLSGGYNNYKVQRKRF
jgi:NADPH-dependent 2,4-dienoyl-CoA reductase/sulfur reductase-like enzyme/rhodanese-related sulfurtransferase